MERVRILILTASIGSGHTRAAEAIRAALAAHPAAAQMQVDVVEELIDYKPCPEKEISELVFLSKVGPKVIRSIDAAWKKTMNSPMKLKN